MSPPQKIASDSDSDSSSSPVLQSVKMAPSTRNLAIVSNVNQQNKPPLIGPGDITPEIAYQIEKAFKGFFANKGIKAEDQVSRALYIFQDHRIEEWIAVQSDDLVKGTFAEFMVKLRALVLAPGWEGKLKTSILGMRQGDLSFIKFYNRLASRNILLRGSSSHLPIDKVRDQLEANMTAELREMVEYERVHNEADFDAWITEVRRIDDHMASKRETDRARYSKRSAFNEPSRNANATSNTTQSSSSTVPSRSQSGTKPEDFRPPKMTNAERDLLAANAGCFKCRRPFVNHRSGECTNGYPTSKFTVDQKYVDSFRTSKPKAVAAVFDRSRGREDSRSRLSGDHRGRRSASPHVASSSHRVSSRSRRSPSRRRSDRFQEVPSPQTRTRSSSPVDRITSKFSTPSPSRPHPVASVIGSSSNAVAYMAPNESNVFSEESVSDDSDRVSIGYTDEVEVSRRFVASVASPTSKVVEREPKAPFHVDHLFWRCAVSSGGTGDVLVPVFDALIDDGAYAVLICSSLVDELGLKRRKLPRPEDVEGAMSTPGDVSQKTTLSEYVNLSLYCPFSGWAARTVRAIIAPSLCAPIILGLPFIVFNNVVVDAGLRTAICKNDSHDLLNPVHRVSKVIKGKPLTESQIRKEARLDAKIEVAKDQMLDHVWDRNNPAKRELKHDFFWSSSTIRACDGEEVRVRTFLDAGSSANLMALETADHLNLTCSKLDVPIPYKCVLNGVNTTLSIEDYVTLTLSTPSFEYTSKAIVALVVPEVSVLTT